MWIAEFGGFGGVVQFGNEAVGETVAGEAVCKEPLNSPVRARDLIRTGKMPCHYGRPLATKISKSHNFNLEGLGCGPKDKNPL